LRGKCGATERMLGRCRTESRAVGLEGSGKGECSFDANRCCDRKKDKEEEDVKKGCVHNGPGYPRRRVGEKKDRKGVKCLN